MLRITTRGGSWLSKPTRKGGDVAKFRCRLGHLLRGVGCRTIPLATTRKLNLAIGRILCDERVYGGPMVCVFQFNLCKYLRNSSPNRSTFILHSKLYPIPSISINIIPRHSYQSNYFSPFSSSSCLCNVATTLSVINSSTFGAKTLQISPRVLNAIVE